MIVENTITDNNLNGFFGVSHFIEEYIKYKLGFKKKYRHYEDHKVRVFAQSDQKLIIDFMKELLDREELEIEVENDIQINNSHNDLIKNIKEYINNMVNNVLRTWNSLTDDKVKEKFLRALANMRTLRKITLVSKRRMQILKEAGIYQKNKGMFNIKNGIHPQDVPTSDVLNEEWNNAQKEKPITIKEYLELFGYTSGEEIFLCLETVALKNYKTVLSGSLVS